LREPARDGADAAPRNLRGLAVVVPCYNAGHRLRPVIEKLLREVDRVLLVDDGSTDGSAETVRDLPLRIVSFPQNRGKGQALLAGFRAALEEPDVGCVAVVDADGQHDPRELPRLYDTFQKEQADLVIGSRTFDLERVPWRSRFGNVLTRTLTGWVLGRPLPDTQSGYRLHSRRLLAHVLETVAGGRYETEMEILIRAVRAGFKVVPVPIRTIYEEGNPSSHFNKLRDSYLIYRRFLLTALKTRKSVRRPTSDVRR
jgi:glycosyltransferase involved in cell wall biosynthesis